MRRYDFNGSAKTVAASATVTFTPSDIPSERVVAYHLWGLTSTTGNAFDTVSRIRVKSNGVTRWDIAADHFADFFEKFSPSNTFYTSSYQTFTIPFYNMLEPDEDLQDTCQFEPGANASIEIVFTSGAAAGSLFCGWTQSNVAPKYYTKFYGQQMNIANQAVNGRFNLAEGGGIMAYSIPMLGLSRLKMVLNGTQWFNMPGMDYSASTPLQGLITETQRQYTAQTPSSTVPKNHVNILTRKPEQGVPATPGQSYVEIDTNGGSTWAGTANEIGIYAAVPVA